MRKPYEPLPTVYDGLFPDGTLLTAPVERRAGRTDPPAVPPRDEPRDR
jgi:hypothetical protein